MDARELYVDWRVRKASEEDVRSLAQIGSATFLETFAGVLDGAAIVDHCEKAHTPETYSAYLTRGGDAWLAEVSPGDAPVGFALLTDADLPGASKDGSDAELKRIYLLSKYHGGGLGAALMNEAIAAARQAGAKRLLLGVYAGNAQAQTFYRRFGFTELASRRFRVGAKDYDDIVFALPLN